LSLCVFSCAASAVQGCDRRAKPADLRSEPAADATARPSEACVGLDSLQTNHPRFAR
jgi:hypothetical protein